jgi:hypothetical protein
MKMGKQQVIDRNLAAAELAKELSQKFGMKKENYCIHMEELEDPFKKGETKLTFVKEGKPGKSGYVIELWTETPMDIVELAVEKLPSKYPEATE